MCYRQTRQRIRLDGSAARLYSRESVLDPHHQLPWDEWLADVIVSAGRKYPLHARLVRVPGEEDHRQLAPTGITSHNPAELRSADFRHLQIQKNQIRLRFIEHRPESKRIVHRCHSHSALAQQSRQSTRHHGLIVHHENLAAFEREILGNRPGAGRCRQARLRPRRSSRLWCRRRWRTNKTLSQPEELFRDCNAIDRCKGLARESLGQVACDLRSLFEPELGRQLGDAFGIPLGSGLQIGGQSGVEQRDCRVVELIDLLEGGRTSPIPGRKYGGRDMLSMRCLGGQNLDATHFCQLSQHLFHVDRGKEEAIDVDFL